MSTLILLRHGESAWNRENRFTGWTDVDLSPDGELEARRAGQLLAEAKLTPEVLHTSVLTRAIRTAELTLAEIGRSWIPVRRHWRLNERHYGALQGLNKRQTAERFGAEQVKAWRRSYRTPPPPLSEDDERHPRHDPRYADLPDELLPASECLADVVERLLPYYHDAIVPDLRRMGIVAVVAHGNSLRALIKHLEGIGDEEIVGLEIPTGVPLVYELDERYRVRSKQALGDAEEIRKAAEAVARQAG